MSPTSRPAAASSGSADSGPTTPFCISWSSSAVWSGAIRSDSDGAGIWPSCSPLAIAAPSSRRRGESLFAQVVDQRAGQRVQGAHDALEQHVSQGRVACEHGTVQVRREDVPVHRALVAVAGVADPDAETGQWLDVVAEHRPAPVVLEARERADTG